MLFSQFAPLLVYLQLFILLLPLFYAHNSTTQSVILIVLTLVSVCSDCSRLGFGFRFGVWVWFRARAWAPEKVLRHFSTVHCFVLLCRTGLLELRAGCLPARLAVYVYASVFVSVSVSMLLWRSLLALKTGSQCLRNRDCTGDSTLCPILSTLGVLIFPETIT